VILRLLLLRLRASEISGPDSVTCVLTFIDHIFLVRAE